MTMTVLELKCNGIDDTEKSSLLVSSIVQLHQCKEPTAQRPGKHFM